MMTNRNPGYADREKARKQRPPQTVLKQDNGEKHQCKDDQANSIKTGWHDTATQQMVAKSNQHPDIGEAHEDCNELPGEGGGHGRDCKDWKEVDRCETKVITEKIGKSSRNAERGVVEKVTLHEEEGQVKEYEEKEHLGSEKSRPGVGSRDPELTIADERFVMNETSDNDEPGNG